MTNSTRSAKEIFLSAVEKPTAGERAAVLDEACGDDVELRRDVEELLEAHDKSGNPLERPALASTILTSSLAERPGTIIDRYKLMEQIGEGGFGLVFVAEQQQPVRRKVALKVIKPGMDTRDVIIRFEAERQALAMLDHPNIAKVLDAGATASGRPYFVMELVRGVPITKYCDQNQLTPPERLQLFVSVCNAIQHAHLKGIVHRDIKPSNVLVTLHDGRPVVKVIDFGVAKALHQQLTEKTIYTRFAQMVGTPLYMSPEQAEMSGLDIDTRSDVYSLGVLLYELLTGTTPFDRQLLSKAAFDEIRRIIREEEPPKPSTRLSQSREALPSIAAHRKTEPARLSRMFHGDLDWITMKALEKDRTRRYETANAFAADILRHLHDEPVEASPPSTAYRLRKFVRKHRGPAVVASAIVATLLLGIVGTTTQMYRARAAESQAQNALDQMEQQVEKAKVSLLKAATAVADPARQGGPDAPPLIENLTFADETETAIKGTIRIVYPDDGQSDPQITLQGGDDGAPLTGLETISLLGQFAINMTQGSRRAEREAKTERDRAERHLANGLLRPIGYSDSYADPAELSSFVEWSAIQESPLKLRVLEIAFENPETAIRVARRAEPAIQACVGLSPGRRAKALELVSAKQRDMAADPRIRVAACWLAMELGSPDLPAWVESVNYFHGPQNRSGIGLEEFAGFAASRTDPRQVSAITAEPLITILEQSADQYIPLVLVDALIAMEPRMDPAQGARAFDALVSRIQKLTDFQTGKATFRGLSALAHRVDDARITRTADVLIGIIETANEYYVLLTPGEVLAAFGPRLDDASLARSASTLISIIENSSDTRVRCAAGSGLAPLALRLDHSQVERAANAFIGMVGKSTDRDGLQAAADGLAALAPRLEPAQAARPGKP